MKLQPSQAIKWRVSTNALCASRNFKMENQKLNPCRVHIFFMSNAYEIGQFNRPHARSADIHFLRSHGDIQAFIILMIFGLFLTRQFQRLLQLTLF
jgi:hypothetical protein